MSPTYTVLDLTKATHRQVKNLTAEEALREVAMIRNLDLSKVSFYIKRPGGRTATFQDFSRAIVNASVIAWQEGVTYLWSSRGGRPLCLVNSAGVLALS